MPGCQNPLLLAGSSNPELANETARQLNLSLGRMKLERFPDGEISVQIQEEVNGRDVFVLQTIAIDPNVYLMELLLIIDALKRGSARSIAAVVPYYGYCRQDRRDKPGVPIAAKLVANLLVEAGAKCLLTVELHAQQLQGFFEIPVYHLNSHVLLLSGLQGIDLKKCVVVAPDIGSIKFARDLANLLKVDFAVVNKHRTSPDFISNVTLIGNVHGKDILLADDICSTGATLVSAAKACQEKGAQRIFGAVTHGLCVDGTAERLEQSPIEALWMTNTIPPNDRIKDCSKINLISVAPLLSHAIGQLCR